MVSYTSECQFECGICHKNTEILTDAALCPKRIKSTAALLQKLQNVKHPDWFYGHLGCGFQGPFPSG